MNITIEAGQRIAEDIASQLLDANGNLKLLKFSDYDQFPDEDLRLFCHFHARYLLPTIELIDFLKEKINSRNTIEIGAGSGDLGRNLNIKMTDNYCQEWPEVKTWYETIKQPIVKYGKDVEKLDALEAIEKYKPEVVIGAWVTQWIDPKLPPPPGGGSIYWIKEDKVLETTDIYIVIGADEIHKNKFILKAPHETINALDFVRSRRKDNVIYIWNK